MVADRRLREAKWLGQVADASLALGLRLDEAQQSKASRVRKDLQGSGKVLRLLLFERRAK